MTFRTAFGASALALLATSAFADPFTVTDIAGREVTFDAPVDRVILGEGRQIFFAAVLDNENPFERVVGWRDDFYEASPETYAISPKFRHVGNQPDSLLGLEKTLCNNCSASGE